MLLGFRNLIFRQFSNQLWIILNVSYLLLQNLLVVLAPKSIPVMIIII